MSAKIPLTVNLTPEAKTALDGICDEHGLVKKIVVSKLVEWWAAQEESVRWAVIGHIRPPYNLDVLRAMLASISSGQADLETLLAAARTLDAGASDEPAKGTRKRRGRDAEPRPR